MSMERPTMPSGTIVFTQAQIMCSLCPVTLIHGFIYRLGLCELNFFSRKTSVRKKGKHEQLHKHQSRHIVDITTSKTVIDDIPCTLYSCPVHSYRM